MVREREETLKGFEQRKHIVRLRLLFEMTALQDVEKGGKNESR